jgi:hypothetical protein
MKHVMRIFFKQTTIKAIIHVFIEKFLTLTHSQNQYLSRGIEFFKKTAFFSALMREGQDGGKNVSLFNLIPPPTGEEGEKRQKLKGSLIVIPYCNQRVAQAFQPVQTQAKACLHRK